MTNIPVHEVADFQGNLDTYKLMEALTKGNVTLYGMPMPVILALLQDYFQRGGTKPITRESIKSIQTEELSSPAGQKRPCTCHPDDNPPVPCPGKYALSECRAAASVVGGCHVCSGGARKYGDPCALSNCPYRYIPSPQAYTEPK